MSIYANEPLISVIIPVYNVRPYLTEALDSVVNQTYQNLEILIIDDGSTEYGLNNQISETHINQNNQN